MRRSLPASSNPVNEALPAVAVARIVAAAARGTPGVADLHPGIAGEIATYGDGGKVGGVRVHVKPTRRATVHVVARYGRPLDELGDDVRARVEEAVAAALPEAGPMPVDVHVADVRVEEEALPEQAAPAGPPAGEDQDRGSLP